MRLRAFDAVEPVPELNEPHALAVVQPWIDAGSVGKVTLSCVEAALDSSELATLRRPGSFFDLTRYRPTIHREDDRVEVDIPNADVTYGRQEGGRDFLFLRLPEPHMLAETYVDSIVELLKAFSVKRYCLIGSMYDIVPYTRPLLVTGAASNLAIQDDYPPAPSRVFYQLTDAGQKATMAEVSDSLMTLYHYTREQRSAKTHSYAGA